MVEHLKDWPLMSLEANITPIAHHCSVCSVIVVFSSFTEFKNRILKLCLTFPFDNSVTISISTISIVKSVDGVAGW